MISAEKSEHYTNQSQTRMNRSIMSLHSAWTYYGEEKLRGARYHHKGNYTWMSAPAPVKQQSISEKRAGDDAIVMHAADFSPEMLRIASIQGLKTRNILGSHSPKSMHCRIQTTPSMSSPYPLPHGTSISDHTTLVKRFAEIRRVLKPGGRFINVETSQPSSSSHPPSFPFLCPALRCQTNRQASFRIKRRVPVSRIIP